MRKMKIPDEGATDEISLKTDTSDGGILNDGIVLVDKPAGMSSFGAVARVRRKLSENAEMVAVRGKDGQLRHKRKKIKVGHTGTLDPFATGLLVVLTGKKTKLANEFLKLDKEYVATVRLGMTSTTGDPEGAISPYIGIRQAFSTSAEPVVGFFSSKESKNPSQEVKLQGSAEAEKACAHQYGKIAPSRVSVEEAIAGFVGEIEQEVPAFSAVKINGQRAYKLAREGKAVEMPRRKVRIYEIEILGYEWPELEIRCAVSSGTYIRTLGEDIGKALGVGGYLTALRRTQVGKYRIEEAKTLEELGIEEKKKVE